MEKLSADIDENKARVVKINEAVSAENTERGQIEESTNEVCITHTRLAVDTLLSCRLCLCADGGQEGWHRQAHGSPQHGDRKDQ